MSAGIVGEPLSVDGVWLGFNSTFDVVGPVSSGPNNAETVGCNSQISANAATMIRANLV